MFGVILAYLIIGLLIDIFINESLIGYGLGPTILVTLFGPLVVVGIAVFFLFKGLKIGLANLGSSLYHTLQKFRD